MFELTFYFYSELDEDNNVSVSLLEIFQSYPLFFITFLGA